MGKVVIPGFRKIETSSSGEGGTTNYNDLSNKPSINNVPLVGNLKTVDLKLTDPTLTEEGVPAEAKTVGTKLEEQSTSLTAVNEELTKKANISDIPTKVSELQNDSNYQTDTDVTTTLTNYATKTYVGEQISSVDHLKREIVTEIPSPETADKNTIYMLKIESATGEDKYKEYLLIDGTVQCIGDTSVDLTDYAKKTEIPTELPANGGNSLTVNGHTVNSDVPENAVFTDTVYDDTEVKGSIDELNSNLVEQKMLGWSVPKECPVQNYVDSDGVFHQIVGRVDLGILNWGYNSTYKIFNSMTPTDATIQISGGINIFTNKYTRDSFATLYNNLSLDKRIFCNDLAYGSNTICVRDLSYTDVTTFKNAMQGVYLYYELDTPITMTIDGNEAVTKIKNDLDRIEEISTTEQIVGTFLDKNLYRNTVVLNFSTPFTVASGNNDICIDSSGGMVSQASSYEGSIPWNSIDTLVNAESFVETSSYIFTNPFIFKKDKTGYWYCRNMYGETIAATKIVLTLYYTKY